MRVLVVFLAPSVNSTSNCTGVSILHANWFICIGSTTTLFSIGSISRVLSMDMVLVERKLLADIKELSGDNCILNWPSGSNAISGNSCKWLCFRGLVGVHLEGLCLP